MRAKLQAIVFIFMIVTTWATFLYELAPLYIVAGLLSFTGARGKAFNMNLWMLSDYATNIILSGWHKVTVSAEIGNKAKKKSETGLVLQAIVNWFWYLIFKEKNHVQAVMEKEDAFTFDAKYAITGYTLFMLAMHTPFILAMHANIVALINQYNPLSL